MTARGVAVSRTALWSLVLTATLGLLAASLAFASASALAEPLPDGRAYEMVTPAQNYDADVYVPQGLPSIFVPNAGEFNTRLPFQVAVDGEAIAYVAAPTVDGTGNSGLGKGDEYLAQHAAGGGWERPVDIQPLGEQDATVNSAFYQAFSPKLTLGILEAGSYEEPNAPLLSPQAPDEGYSVLYTHSLAGGNYQPFFMTAPLDRSPLEFATSEVSTISSVVPHQVDYAGASANYDHLLFEANAAFGGTGAASGTADENNLYESIGGRLSLVNVLPTGKTEADATFGATAFESPEKNPPDFSNVISEDGSRVFWTNLNPGKEALYVSEGVGGPGERTVQVDASQVPGGAGGGGRFWTASKDGSKVFFTDAAAAALTTDTQAGSGENLYMYEVSSGRLVNLTPAPEAGVVGVLGEGTPKVGAFRVYFAATGVLSTEPNDYGMKAELGAYNLYVLQEGGSPTFVTQLSEEDGVNAIRPLTHLIAQTGDWQPGLGHRTAEVTPDGRSLVFMSNNQEIDGHYEEVNGSKLEEVYVYDAETGGLFCASCGSVHDIAPVETRESERGLGAFVPINYALTFQPTVVSADGSRVFFDSAEPLVSGDTNGELDVYEWDLEGTHGCEATGGCVYLLSGGDASTSSFLVGSDEAGNNVFFVTRAQLVSEDENENYDLYDARVNGLQRVSPPACTGTGCQGVPATAPTFTTPSSVTFEGVGNFPPPAETTAPVKPKVKTRPLTDAQKLAKALAACHAKHPKRRRASCEARARRRYGTVKGKK